jgi:hypothetical protein
MLTFLGDTVDVLVTTCNQAIARKICTVEPYRLNSLGDDVCWEIIKTFIHFEEHEELENMGRWIAGKYCCGLPAAAIECLRYMQVISRNPTGWEDIMKRQVWYCLPTSVFLSYLSMPPELRLCLDYYGDIFPKGHNIVKDDLVNQCIALDFFEPSESLSATEIADGYITKLLDMSFLQTAKLGPVSNYVLTPF